jgi:DNA-binding transcriptional MerR regulator
VDKASDEVVPSAAEEADPAPRRSSQGPSRHRRSRRKPFYSIGEVCATIGVKPHVLRYWESQFRELSPSKNRSGNRVYQAEEIELIALIHKLVHEERYTVEGARKRIAELRAAGTTAEHSSVALQRIFLRTLVNELQELHDLLDPSALRRQS